MLLRVGAVSVDLFQMVFRSGRGMPHVKLPRIMGNGIAGTIAVVACDKPPVGTLAALLEHNQPSIIMSDGSIHPGHDPKTGETIDLVTAYQVAGHPDAEYRHHIACHACPGYGSCGGMFTYNTMQTFIGVVGMQPLHMVAPPSDDPRRTSEFADQLVGYLAELIKKNLRPRDIVGRDSLRNAVIVAMAVGAWGVVHFLQAQDFAGFDDKTYQGDAYPAYGWAAAVAEVEVDLDTAEVTVERVLPHPGAKRASHVLFVGRRG